MQDANIKSLPRLLALASQISCKRRGRKFIISKSLNQSFYDYAEGLSRDLSASAWSMTFTFGQELSKQVLWSGMGSFIQEVNTLASQYSPYAVGLFVVEVHRKTSLTSTRGKDMMAGRPHLHAILWFYNDFVRFDASRFRRKLRGKVHVDLVVKRLPRSRDVSKNMAYVLKSTGSEASKRLADALGWESPGVFMTCLAEAEPLTLELLSMLNSYRLKSTAYAASMRRLLPGWSYTQLPPVVRGPLDVQLKELFYRCFESQGYAVHNNLVFRVRQPFKYTWELSGKVSTFLAGSFGLQIPAEIRDALASAIRELSRGGRRYKEDPILPLLPKINFALHLTEFPDGVYDLVSGRMARSVFHGLSCGRSCTIPFHELAPPVQTLQLLESQLNALAPCGRHGPRGRVLDDALRLDILYGIGQVFHSAQDRKDQRFLYFYGDSNTFKTGLVELIVDGLAPSLVFRLSKRSSSFQLAKLPEDNVCLVIDDLDFRRFNPGLLQDLASGTGVMVEEKFKPGEVKRYRGGLLVTSNFDFPSTHRSSLRVRSTPLSFKYKPGSKHLGAFLKDKNLRMNETHALSVLANLVHYATDAPLCVSGLEVPRSWLHYKEHRERSPYAELMRSNPIGARYFDLALNYVLSPRLRGAD